MKNSGINVSVVLYSLLAYWHWEQFANGYALHVINLVKNFRVKIASLLFLFFLDA
jgi:hypothetical protein